MRSHFKTCEEFLANKISGAEACKRHRKIDDANIITMIKFFQKSAVHCVVVNEILTASGIYRFEFMHGEDTKVWFKPDEPAPDYAVVMTVPYKDRLQ